MTGKRCRLLCLALALCMMITLIPAAAGNPTSARADSTRMGITLMDNVNVRYGAGTNEKLACTLPINHVCEILSDKVVNGVRWYRISTIDPSRKNSNTYQVYIHGDFFRELTAEEITLYTQSGTVATPTPVPEVADGGPTPTPAVTTAQPTPAPKATPTPTPKPYHLVVHYIYAETGETAWPDHSDTLWDGEAYLVVSPIIPEYQYDIAQVAGIMPAHNVEYTVMYFAKKPGWNYYSIEDYETALGIGDIQMHVGVCFE